MLTTFDRYLLRTLLIATLVTLIFLIGVDFLVQSSDQSGDIGQGNYTFLIMSYTIALEIPDRIIKFLPAAILIGTIMSLGQLGVQNELTVVRTAGISRLRMSLSGILMAIVLGFGLIGIGEYIAPTMTAKSELIRNQALGRTTNTPYANGLWINNDNNLIHIGNFNEDGTLNNLRFYKENNGVTITEATKATFKTDHWQLENAISLTATINKFQTTQADDKWHTTLTPANLYTLANTENATTLHELITLTRFLKANNINHNHESLRLWQRLLLPLSTLTMLLLALPFAYSPKRGGANGSRLVIGILLGVSYYVLQGILSSLALLLNWLPILGAVLPIAILGIPPLIMLMRDETT